MWPPESVQNQMDIAASDAKSRGFRRHSLANACLHSSGSDAAGSETGLTGIITWGGGQGPGSSSATLMITSVLLRL
jgi:hypothetical protein